MHPIRAVTDKVIMPFGFLHWHMLLWLIENAVLIFTAFIPKSVRMFISSVLGIPCAFGRSKACPSH